MKRLLFVIIIEIVINIFLSSCLKCKECTQYDNAKNVIGTKNLYGKDLKNAEKDTAHYKCN